MEGASAYTAKRDAADTLDDVGQRIVDIVIPETQDVPAPHAHVAVSARIIFALGLRTVCGTIYLHDQTRTNAGKVGDKRPDRMLSSKADAMHIFPHARPEHRLGIGQSSPQRACA